jgi:magnesium chelatase family protein
LRQAGEAKLVAGIDVFGIASITQLIAFLRDEPMPLVDPIEVIGDPAGKHAKRRLDLADVAGQVEAKWACEVAAAGRHHMLFQGPPGVGKTCSRSVFRVYFPILTCMTPSRCLRCTRWLA